MESVVLKARPEEFLVVESALLRSQAGTHAPFTYLRVRKSGLTTFEAVELVAQHFGLAQKDVHYAGLKDEDGLTEQTISLAASPPQSEIEHFNREHAASPHRFIELRHDGQGCEPMRTGQLNGNSFRLIVRNLSSSFANRVRAGERYTIHFLNYYDVQRFGVPHGPKTTHLIGGALVEKDYEGALYLLRKAETPESRRALAFHGDAEGFFEALEPRVHAFFKSSYSSHLWNGKLSSLVREACGDDTYEYSSETISFLFTPRQDLIVSVLNKQRTLEHVRYYGDGGAGGTPGFRPTVVQTQLLCSSIDRDEMHPQRYKCDLSFFLPSGTYATMCIKQLVNLTDISS